MNFGKIKTLLIAILAAVNIYLGVCILLQYRSGELVSSEDQRLAAELLASAGLCIDESVIPDRLPQSEIYEYIFSDKEYTAAAGRRLFAAAGESDTDGAVLSFDTFIYRDGVKLTRETSAESAYFAVGTESVFSFEYKRDDGSEWEADLAEALLSELGLDDTDEADESETDTAAAPIISSARYDDARPSEFPTPVESTSSTESAKSDPIQYSFVKLSGAEAKKFEQAKSFVSAVCGDDRLEPETVSLYEERTTGALAAIVGAEFDGNEIIGQGAVLIYLDDNLVYAAGELIFGSPERSYTGELRDQISILFAEKDMTASESESEASESTAADDSKTFSASGEAEGEPSAETEPSISAEDSAEERRIVEMKMVYTVGGSSYGTRYYLIPAWKLTYADGTVHIRSAVNGELCE